MDGLLAACFAVPHSVLLLPAWLTPVVTLDRAVLVAVWTPSIAVGRVLEDRRLLFFMDDEYRSSMARVPGDPGIPTGPLARVPAAPPPLAAAAASA